MKIAKFALAFLTVKTQAALSCFHCDASNIDHCDQIGMMKECMDNETTCMIELRKRDGVVEGVCNMLKISKIDNYHFFI